MGALSQQATNTSRKLLARLSQLHCNIKVVNTAVPTLVVRKEVVTGYYSSKRRNSGLQCAMAKAVNARDKVCLFSGSTAGLKTAHILGLGDIARIPREKHYSSTCGVLMRSDFEDSYDKHEWYFEADGTIVFLWDKCRVKDDFKSSTKSDSDPTRISVVLPAGLDKEVIELKISDALQYQRNYIICTLVQIVGVLLATAMWRDIVLKVAQKTQLRPKIASAHVVSQSRRLIKSNMSKETDTQSG